MAIIQTQIDTNSAEYQQNSEAMSVAVDEARTIERRVIELARSKEERYKQRGSFSATRTSNAPFRPRSTILRNVYALWLFARRR